MNDLENLFQKSQYLRAQYKFNEAFELVSKAVNQLKLPNDIIWTHQPILWSNISAGMCQLTRRQKKDAEFIVKIWENKEFVYQFHRHAPPLTMNIDSLRSILDKEYFATLSELNQIHWIIRDKSEKPFGLLSLTNVSLTNRSAEVLVGVLPESPLGLATAAMLIVFQFFFKSMGFHKLYSFIYEDNPHSLKGTLHLGFIKEGFLRQHILDPKTGKFMNLIQTGILSSEFETPSNMRLMDRLLKS